MRAEAEEYDRSKGKAIIYLDLNALPSRVKHYLFHLYSVALLDYLACRKCETMLTRALSIVTSRKRGRYLLFSFRWI